MSKQDLTLNDFQTSEEVNSDFFYQEKEIDEDPEILEEETKSSISTGNFHSGETNFIGVDGGLWRKRKNYYGRIIELKQDYVVVDCLINSQKREYEEREFIRLLFENISDLSVGKYVIIRMFLREGKSQITINDADNLVDKEIFENTSQFSDLEDIDNPPISIDKL